MEPFVIEKERHNWEIFVALRYNIALGKFILVPAHFTEHLFQKVREEGIGEDNGASTTIKDGIDFSILDSVVRIFDGTPFPTVFK